MLGYVWVVYNRCHYSNSACFYSFWWSEDPGRCYIYCMVNYAFAQQLQYAKCSVNIWHNKMQQTHLMQV